jgi:hypothetical protein
MTSGAFLGGFPCTDHFLALLMAVAVSGCGGTDPLTACKDGVSAVCDKSFACFPTEAEQIYGNVSNCKTTFGAATCTTDNTTCPAGTSFNSGNASQCVNDYKNESCTDFANHNIPSSCLNTCT